MKPSKTGTCYALLVLFCVLLSFAFSCGSADVKYIGHYEGVTEGVPTGGDVYLDLKEKGEGSWMTDNDEVSFLWYLKGNELRFNTKEGGVIVGEILDDTIRVTLPGNRTFVFKKSQ